MSIEIITPAPEITGSGEKRLGSREIFGIFYQDGTCLIIAGCPLHPDASIQFKVPAAPARTYFEATARPSIQKLFPDLRKEHREILFSGTSPAEFDQMRGTSMPATHEAFMRAYSPLGYVFERDDDL